MVWVGVFSVLTQDLDRGGLRKVELNNTLFLLSFTLVKKKKKKVTGCYCIHNRNCDVYHQTLECFQ